MPYSEPIGPAYPRYAAAVRHAGITGSYPLTLDISHLKGDESEADADAIMQKAVDALAGAGFEILEATKGYEYRQNLTVTPA